MFKMIMPVPSPNGTNHENLYMTIPRGAQLAHDAMPPSMSRRRLARDDVQPMTDQDIDEWLQLLERLPQEDRDELKAEFSARARGEDPGNGSDPDLTGSDRRRARNRRAPGAAR